jgi:hypothetical protein
MNAPPVNRPGRAAAGAPASRKAGRAETTGGTAVGVTAVPLLERRNHEAQQQLELGASDGRGGGSAPPLVGPIRWLL